MDDTDIVQRIQELTEQEHALERAHVGQGLSADELERLHATEVALDQCWDLAASTAGTAPRGPGPQRVGRPIGRCGRELRAMTRV